MKYCASCEKMVAPSKKAFSWGWFLVWTICSGGTLIWLYPLYYVLMVGKSCPICNGNRMLPKKPVQ